MNDRDLMEAVGVEMPNNNGSGIVDPRTLGMVVLSPNQLKNISKMLNQKAATMTREEIEREAIMSTGSDLSASPEEEAANRKRISDLKSQQQAWLTEKQRQYQEWEAKNKK